MFDAHAQKNILIVMLQIFDNLFHYKNILTVQWIKRLKLCMVTMATLPPAKGLKYRYSVLAEWDTNTRCPQKSDMLSFSLSLKVGRYNVWTRGTLYKG